MQPPRDEIIAKLRSIGHLQACRKFFVLLKELIEVINVDKLDPRISFYVRKDKSIFAAVNFHRALGIINKNGVWLELAFLEKNRGIIEKLDSELIISELSKGSEIIYVKFAANKTQLLDDTRLMAAWQNALIELLSRGNASPKHSLHLPELFELAENENNRNELFWEIEHPDEIFQSANLAEEKAESYQIKKPDFPKNQLFYGPPGTGKTFTAKQLAKPFAFSLITFHPSFDYHDFIEGLRPEMHNGQLNYTVKEGIFMQFCRKALLLAGYDSFVACLQDLPENRKQKFEKAPPFVVIIDEINRANVARVFGELLTLLEPNKRLGAAEETVVMLPFSHREVGVPGNLYLIGTMNSADRTTALLDNALRRRFYFKEFRTDYSLLPAIAEIDLARFLQTLNERIAYFLGPDFEIGHAYFLEITNYQELCHVMAYQVLPLLFEYFFDDKEKVRQLFGENYAAYFILKKEIDFMPQPIQSWDEPRSKNNYSIHPDLLIGVMPPVAFQIFEKSE